MKFTEQKMFINQLWIVNSNWTLGGYDRSHLNILEPQSSNQRWKILIHCLLFFFFQFCTQRFIERVGWTHTSSVRLKGINIKGRFVKQF